MNKLTKIVLRKYTLLKKKPYNDKKITL